ncbi:protoglobin domain-containing protein [Tepidibacillus marianensis]|uniref:protoglobin domain-containing protein n=1 Tax=Tepidibacillus marianensis TaxID=3131995 RepID=UPI0030CF0D85
MFKRKAVEELFQQSTGGWSHHSVTIQVQDPTIQQKLAMIGINEETLQIMKEQKHLFEENADQVVDQFYKKVSAIPHLMDIINRHSTIDRLKVTQKVYFLSLTDGKIDEQYINNRRKVGQVHDQIRLDSEWFLVLIRSIINRSFHY